MTRKNATPPEPEWASRQWIYAKFDISPSTQDRAAKRGDIIVARRGRRSLRNVASVREWLAKDAGQAVPPEVSASFAARSRIRWDRERARKAEAAAAAEAHGG